MLAKANVMTFRKCGTQGRVNKMVLHAANHAFAKAFLIKHFRRSERVRQHMTETLQVAGCVEGGVLGVAAATVQRNVELRDSPEQQAASLGGTGVSAEQANAPPVLSSALVATHTPVAPQATGSALMLIDRLPEGPDRTSLIMRAFEHELAKGDDAHKANEARKDAEFKAEEDRRIVVHNATMAEITDRRLQNRQRAEADLSRTNLEIRDVKLQQLRSLLDHCTDDHQRAYLQGAYAMVAQAPTEVKLAVDTTLHGNRGPCASHTSRPQHRIGQPLRAATARALQRAQRLHRQLRDRQHVCADVLPTRQADERPAQGPRCARGQDV